MNWVLRVLSLVSLPALLVTAYFVSASSAALYALSGLPLDALATFAGLAEDFAIAAAVAALVVTGQRRHWNWFAGTLVLVVLCVFWPIVDALPLSGVSGYGQLQIAGCGTGGQCPTPDYVAAAVRALAPLVVLIYTFTPRAGVATQP